MASHGVINTAKGTGDTGVTGDTGDTGGTGVILVVLVILAVLVILVILLMLENTDIAHKAGATLLAHSQVGSVVASPRTKHAAR